MFVKTLLNKINQTARLVTSKAEGHLIMIGNLGYGENYGFVF